MRISHSRILLALASTPSTRQDRKAALHGQNWVAVTGKPLAATAGARIFMKGGNAVDAACAMIAATSTMWDTLGWGGETQALIYNPHTGKVIGVNALGVAPTGATPEFYKSKGYDYPPEFGPLAAVTPGTPGGIMVMLAEYGKLSLAEVLAPSIEMADGYPIEAQTADKIERWKDELRKWPESRRTFLVHEMTRGSAEARLRRKPAKFSASPSSRRHCASWSRPKRRRSKRGASRKQAIMAAYDRFYKGDIARSSRAARGKSAACTRPRISPTGACTSKSRSARTTKASRSTSSRTGCRAR